MNAIVFVTNPDADPSVVTNGFDRDKYRSADVRAAQMALEDAAREAAVNRFRDAVELKTHAGHASETGAGQSVMRAHIGCLVKAIEWARDEGRAVGSYGQTLDPKGRPPAYVALLSQLPVELAALHTLKVTLDAALSPTGNVASAARNLGAALEREAMMEVFKRAEPAFVAACAEGFRSRGASDEVAAEQLLSQMRFKASVDWTPWDKKQRRALALNLIAVAIMHTGLFDKEFVNTFENGKFKGEARLTLTPQGRDWWERIGKAIEAHVLDPLPMICEPLPWTGAYGGGYVSPNTPPQPLVKTDQRQYLNDLANHDLANVLDAVNAVQATPWRVNTRVLEVLKQLWQDGGNAAGLPPRFFDEVLPGRLPDNAPEEAIKERNRVARELYAKRSRIESKGWRVVKTMQLAQRFSAYDAIFFPCQLDFRGRMYSMVPVLNPQGTDLEKGLLEFAEGKPLGSEDAACWLAIHGANSFGKDKLPLQDRINWVTENARRIQEVAADPLAYVDWWGHADKPFMFLAWCFEWSDYLAYRDPDAFLSRLPVSLDGTCNGLQHLSAMTRDAKGGAAVNLVVGGDRPADVYQTVANAVIERLHEKALLGDEVAKGWLQFGIDRKLTKRTVMVVPYGGTTKSCRDYVRAAVMERVEAGAPCPFARGRELLDASTVLANVVWESLTESLAGARQTMRWLQRCAHLLAKEGKPVRWTAPSGFPVLQAYRDTKDVRIEYGPSRKPFRHKFRKELDGINAAEQRNGISPNYTHSLDAAHLVYTVNTCVEYGVTSFAMVHDSYGTHAADVQTLSSCLRAAFAYLYAGDPLAALERELRTQFTNPNDCPERPTYGTWEPSSVLDAEFFFH